MAEEKVPDNLEIADELIAERRSAAPGELPDDMPKWMANVISWIDIFNLWVGKFVSWLLVPMCLAMVYEVLARKYFVAPTVWAYDVSRMLYGAMFMLGAGYALSRGVHIRADFIYRNWSPRTQGLVDATLYIVLFFPGIAIFMYMATDYATESWIRSERANDTSWMPMLGPIKTAIPLGALFLILQGISELCKSLYAARNNRWPV